MNQNEVAQKIAEYLGLAPEDIDKNASLRDDLELGPLELNDLLNYLSAEFNITFDPEDLEDLHKVDDLVVLVEDNILEQQ